MEMQICVFEVYTETIKVLFSKTLTFEIHFQSFHFQATKTLLLWKRMWKSHSISFVLVCNVNSPLELPQ